MARKTIQIKVLIFLEKLVSWETMINKNLKFLGECFFYEKKILSKVNKF